MGVHACQRLSTLLMKNLQFDPEVLYEKSTTQQCQSVRNDQIMWRNSDDDNVESTVPCESRA
jgi:hypothetical protein